MTDEPTTKSSGQTSTSPTRLTQGDPARRPFGDQGTDVAKKAEPAKGPYPLPGAQTDEDGGEYDKGPRADAATQPTPTKAAPDQRPMPMHQPKPAPAQSQPATKRDESGKDACRPSKELPGKPDAKSGGGCATS